MKYNKDYPSFYIIAYLSLIPIVFFGYFTKEYFLIEKAREYKIKNKVNMGCLVLEKRYRTKNGIDKFDINIDGEKYLLSDVIVKGFPFKNKYYNFQKEISYKESCYRVSYVKVKILFFKRSFIYDLES